MRKIKTKTKDNIKRMKKLADLLKELIQHHTTTHDKQKIAEISQKALGMNPTDYPSLVENVASVCIDNSLVDIADKATQFMEENLPPTSYRLFLRCRVLDLQRKYGESIDYAERALKS